MKWSDIIAQGFSPGLGETVNRRESGDRGVCSVNGVLIPPIALDIGCHFQGTSFDLTNPGLKPWAMICSRFAAKSRS